VGSAEDVAVEMKSEIPMIAERQVIPSVVLAEKIAAVRHKQVGVAAGTGIGMAVGVFIILLGIAMLLDWWMDCPLGVRVVMLSAVLGVAGVIAWRFILTPVRHQPDDDTIALTVEKARPQFRSRLISSIQFPRPGVIVPGTASSLARVTIAETEALARPLDFNEVISTRELQKVSTWAIAVLALGIFSFMFGGQVSLDLLKRAFLSSTPVPRHTRVEVLTGNTRIGRGDAIRIEALARGVVPRIGKISLKMSGKRTQEFVLEKDKEGKFIRNIENVQQDFDYTVKLNDGVSRSHRIEVVPRPTTASIECEQIFPAYTQLPNAKRALGDLSLLAGSKLKLTATATRDIKRAFLRLAGLSNDIPMQIDAQKPRELRGEFAIPPKGLTGFSIEMVDTDGMESRDSAIYRIDVIPDRAPKVRVTYPDRREELVTRAAMQPIGFEATDDFQVAKARLRYRVGENEEGELKTIDLDLGTNVVKQARNVYEWSIRDFQPPLIEGTRIEFWLEAEDNNNVTGPGVGVTEHQLLRVVSENEKRADLLNRAGDFIGTISDVTGDQEKLNANLGVIILERKSQ
jgi:hypothetical protein